MLRERNEQALQNTSLAVAHNAVGDIGAAHGLEDGSIPKIALHSIVGGVSSSLMGGSFGSGASAGGVAELVSGLMTDSCHTCMTLQRVR